MLILLIIFNLILLGLNKDFKRMLAEHAEFKALELKDMLTASDGTRKVNMPLCPMSMLCIRLHIEFTLMNLETFENHLIHLGFTGVYRYCSLWKMDW